MKRLGITLLVCSCSVLAASKKKAKVEQPSALETYTKEATLRAKDPALREGSAGSLWNPAAGLADLARDRRASQLDDVVTILVAEQATAVASGTTKTSRSSSAKASVNSLFGPKKPTSALASLADLSGQTQLDGQGTTTRGTTLTTTLTARVVHVLPNGYLVVEGTKQIQVDSEHQVITVLGVIRPDDITTANTIASNRLAEMEVRINGKGVISDATHRPFFLYRLLTGLLPF